MIEAALVLDTLEYRWIPSLRVGLEIVGTTAFAVSGVLMAATRRFNVVGLCIVAFIAAFGGGTVRDLLLDQRPFFWVQHVNYVWGLMALCLYAYFFLRTHHIPNAQKAMIWPSAIGLGLFAGIGVDMAVALHLPPLVAVMMGVITSTFGGVMRDVVCNQAPTAFQDQRPFALCAFAGGWLDIALRQWSDVPQWLPMTACALFATSLRLIVIWRNWQLPTWRV